MNEEFKKIEDLYGISKSETSKLERKYKSIDNLKDALKNNSIDFLKSKDIERLKKYFIIQKSNSQKLCVSCKIPLPDILDNGICPYCRVRNIL